MITVVNGDTNSFRAMAYGEPDLMTMQWCQQRQAEQFEVLDPTVRENFLNQTGTVFGQIDYEGIARMAKALNNQLDTMWFRDIITPLSTMAQLQNPPPVMINWMMACPEVREQYHQQTIAGYDEYYTDPEPGRTGEEHYYYRRAVNGLFIEDEATGEMEATEWFEDLWKPEDALDIVDQRSIQETWMHLVHALARGDTDPTSRFNAQM